MAEYKEYKGFIVGEKVICILNNRSSLSVGKEYSIDSISVEDEENFWISVKNDGDFYQSYHYTRFIDKNDFRKYLIDDILK